jgi:hypothetical protein
LAVSQARSPSTVLAEGLHSEKSRGDKTAIELFVAGVLTWEARSQHLVRILTDGKSPNDRVHYLGRLQGT